MLHSDGYIVSKNKTVLAGFSNKEKALISCFMKLVSETFVCRIHLKIDKRDGVLTAELPSLVARILYNKFGGKTTETVHAPRLRCAEIAPYLRGVFDGDGTIMVYDNKFFLPTVRFCTGSGVYAEELKNLLTRLDIFSRVRFCRNKRGHEWWIVEAKRQKDVLAFIETIGSVHPRKKRIMQHLAPELKRRLSARRPAA